MSSSRETKATVGIEARGLRRTFGSVRAVVDASLSVPSGSVTALIGPNGSGKTTLMLMLSGLLSPDDGTVSVAVPHGTLAAGTRVA